MKRLYSNKFSIAIVGLSVAIITISGSFALAEQLLTEGADDANSPGVFPNDEYFPMQWHLYNTGQSGGTPGADIRATEAWEITTGDPNIIIAVIDCGVDSQHPDLVNNLVAGYDFYDNDEATDPIKQERMDAHGTLCAGIIAAEGNNGIGIVGVAPNCKIMPIRHGCSTDWITQEKHAEAIRWAATHGADIISCSWSRYFYDETCLYSAIQDVTKIGGIGRDGKGCILLFAININGNRTHAFYTGSCPEVITVGATDHDDERWHYSGYGPELDLVAPSGCDGEWCGESFFTLWSTDLTGSLGNSIFNDDPNILDYAQYWGGTSVSTPIAAGVAALILSVEPNLTCDHVRYILTHSAKDLGEPGLDEYYGWGRVDAKAALDMVLAVRADLHKDGKVDLKDLSTLIEFWGTSEPWADIAPAGKRDGIVDEKDLDLLIKYWKTEYHEFDLVAHWKLDETEGMFAADSVGNNDAVVLGGTEWQPAGGQIDGALQLDGASGYAITSFVLNPANAPFSIIAWIKSDAPGQVVISQQSASNWLATDVEGNLMTELKSSDQLAEPLISEKVITDGQWHCIALVWNGSHRTLYVDSIVVAEDTQDGLEGSENGLHIGAGKMAQPGTFFSGLIDDIRIYNRAVRP